MFFLSRKPAKRRPGKWWEPQVRDLNSSEKHPFSGSIFVFRWTQGCTLRIIWDPPNGRVWTCITQGRTLNLFHTFEGSGSLGYINFRAFRRKCCNQDTTRLALRVCDLLPTFPRKIEFVGLFPQGLCSKSFGGETTLMPFPKGWFYVAILMPGYLFGGDMPLQ